MRLKIFAASHSSYAYTELQDTHGLFAAAAVDWLDNLPAGDYSVTLESEQLTPLALNNLTSIVRNCTCRISVSSVTIRDRNSARAEMLEKLR